MKIIFHQVSEMWMFSNIKVNIVIGCKESYKSIFAEDSYAIQWHTLATQRTPKNDIWKETKNISVRK